MEIQSRRVRNIEKGQEMFGKVDFLLNDLRNQGVHVNSFATDTSWLFRIDGVRLIHGIASLFSYDVKIIFNVVPGTWTITYDRRNRTRRLGKETLVNHHGGIESFKGWLGHFVKKIQKSY